MTSPEPESEVKRPASASRSSEAQPAAAPAPRPGETDQICWCCAGRTIKRHCKIVCTNCGFTRDCSDP